MAVSPEFTEHLRDLLGGLGPFTVRRMFGGAGLLLDDAMFALVADETLYMKTDAELAQAYAAAGSEPFVYEGKGKGKRIEISYWRLPDSALDDPDEALGWARQSLVPAERAAAEKRAAKVRKAARKGRG